jgi:hypothetical protein
VCVCVCDMYAMCVLCAFTRISVDGWGGASGHEPLRVLCAYMSHLSSPTHPTSRDFPSIPRSNPALNSRRSRPEHSSTSSNQGESTTRASYSPVASLPSTPRRAKRTPLTLPRSSTFAFREGAITGRDGGHGSDGGGGVGGCRALMG